MNGFNGYDKKYGAKPTKKDLKESIIVGAKRYLDVGMFDMVYLKEKELHEVYGMSYAEIEAAIYG